MIRTLALYALAMGLAAFLLQWLEFKYALRVFSSVIYVAVWEVNLAMTDYAFYEQWADAEIEKKRASGATPEEVAAYSETMAGYAEMGSKPLMRIPITFLEIFPIGLLVSLVSAAILRNSKVLPASA